MLSCKRCKSEKFVKNGFDKGKQRYKCKECGYNFTDTPPAGYSPEVKRQAIHLYLEGLRFRSIERILKLSHVAVSNWVKASGVVLEPQIPAEVEIMEIDEMHHYVKKKTKNYGSGWLLIELASRSLPVRSVIVVEKQA